MIRVKPLLAGAAAFAASHLVVRAAWSAWFGGGSDPPWFLNDSGTAVAFTAGCLIAAGALASLGASTRTEAVAAGGNVAAGALVAMAVVLSLIGPGTLFPIVLAAGGLIAVVSGLAGALGIWSARIALARRRS